MALHSVNLQLVIKEYIVKMLNDAGVGMKCLVLDDFTVRKLTHVSQIQVYRPCPRPYASLLTPPPRYFIPKQLNIVSSAFTQTELLQKEVR